MERSFAETYPDEQFVQAPLAQITWYHNIDRSSGMAASIGCFKLAKDANDRLDRITKELMDD